MKSVLAALLLSSTAQASTLYITDTSGNLSALDIATNTVTAVGSFGTPFDWGGISYDETTGIIWMVSGRSDRGLYIVDPATGIGTLVGYHGLDDVFADAVDPNTGDIYALQANGFAGLYSLDAGNGAATFIGTPSLSPNNGYVGVGGADFDAFGNIIANSSFSSYIFSIDPTSGAATYLGDAGVSVSDNGLAVDTDTGMYYIAELGGQVYSIDPTTFAATNIYSGSSFTGATVIPDGGQRFTLRLSGTCPGPVTVDITGATPGGTVAIAYSRTGAGSFTIPSGPCAGRALPIDRARLGTTTTANGAGMRTLTPTFGAGLCGISVVAVDVATCSVSNVAIAP